jgi:hypothetical protein
MDMNFTTLILCKTKYIKIVVKVQRMNKVVVWKLSNCVIDIIYGVIQRQFTNLNSLLCFHRAILHMYAVFYF